MHALEGEVVAELGMDHRRLRIERGLRIGDGRELLVVDLNQLAAVLGFGAAARHHGADRFAGPAGAVDRDGVLRRGLDALQMRQHADPGRDDLGKLRAGDDGDHARRFLRRVRIDAFDFRMRMRRAHERHMRHARQHHVADILRAALHQPRHVGPRHRAADIGVRPVERGEDGRGVVDDFHALSSLPRAALRHRLDGIDDGVVAGAAAVVAGNVLADFLAARRKPRFRLGEQQFLRGQQHAGRAEAALQGVALLERRPAGRRSRPNPTRPRWSRPWRRRIAPRASGSRARSAPFTRTVQAPQTPCSQPTWLPVSTSCSRRKSTSVLPRVDRLVHGLAVHGERDIAAHVAHGARLISMSCLATRRSSTPARCFFVAPVACTSSCGSRSAASAFTAASTSPPASAAFGLLGPHRRVADAEIGKADVAQPLAVCPCALAARPTMA